MRKLLFVVVAGSWLCTSAQELPRFTEVKRLSDNVNGKGEEAKPVLNSDGTIMYFVRAFDAQNVGYDAHPENEDIWETIKDESGEWKMAEHEVTINDDKNNSIIGQGKEDHFFLLNTYQDKKHLQYGIALTRKLAEHSWIAPEVISIPKLKYQGDFYDFYITHDETALLISIRGEDTKGEEDLYVSLYDGSKWGEPINLGTTINTAGFEMSPFLTEDKRYLYFSSNGRSDGFGDADIYVSERLDDTWTNWSAPKNMGEPVNSTAMDCYFTMADNETYYFSSNRTEGTGLDIYEALKYVPVPLPDPVVMGKVYSAKDSSLISAILDFNSAGANSKSGVSSNENAGYSIQLKLGENYRINTKKEGFYPGTDQLDLTAAQLGDTITKDVYLSPVEVGVVIKMENIFFDFDKATLRPESREELDKLVKLMTDYPKMKIAIGGHTDSKGSDEYNQRLSQDRVNSVLAYVSKKGLGAPRVSGTGYGEAKPVATNDTDEGRQANRRVEFEILEK